MRPPGMLVSDTGVTLPAVLALRKTGCWLTLLPFSDPTATTVSPGPTAATGADSPEVPPSDPVGRQAAPVPVLV